MTAFIVGRIMFKVAKGRNHYYIAGARPLKIDRTPELDRAFFQKDYRPFEAASNEVKEGIRMTEQQRKALQERLEKRFPGHKVEVTDNQVICGQIRIPIDKIGPIPEK